MVDRVDIQGVLEQMRNLRSQVTPPVQQDAGNSQFANTIEQMRKQIQNVSDQQSAQAVQGVNNDASQNVQAVGEVPSFGDMFKSSIDTVNNNQQTANALATRYELGDPKVDLPEVMIALQKSSVSFQAIPRFPTRRLSFQITLLFRVANQWDRTMDTIPQV